MPDPRRPIVDIYDFDFPEALQADDDARDGFGITAWLVGAAVVGCVLGLAAIYGVMVSQ